MRESEREREKKKTINRLELFHAHFANGSFIYSHILSFEPQICN